MGDAVAATHAQIAALLRLGQQGRVLTIALNRPSKRNAPDDGIIPAIGDCFATCLKATSKPSTAFDSFSNISLPK